MKQTTSQTITIRVAAIADPKSPHAPGHDQHLLVRLDPPNPRSLELTIRSIEPSPTDNSNPPILFPALVNAHAHLDLSPIGPQPWDQGGAFTDWARMIIQRRRDLSSAHDRDTAPTELGIDLTLAGPTAAVADIAGAASTAPATAFARSPLEGVSFIELFGFGPRSHNAIEQLAPLADALEHIAAQSHPRQNISFSPHAPYSASTDLYDAASRTALESPHLAPLIATHLAEHADERRLLTSAEGPMRDLLERLNSWNDDTTRTFTPARSPVAHLAPHLRQAPAILAHVNDASDEDIQDLAQLAQHWRTLAKDNRPTAPQGGVVFCPRCHAYFAHEDTLGEHRFNDMLAAGIPVALGTDSIVNLPDDQADRLSTLDDARLLATQKLADPTNLLRMITTTPATMLGLEEQRFSIPPSPTAHTLAGLAFFHPPRDHSRDDHPADPNSELIRSDAPARLVWNGLGFHPELENHLTEQQGAAP